MISLVYNFQFITILFAHRDKKDKTQVLPTYEVFSWELHLRNYITNITHIHMKKSRHINESIPVTITHVKEKLKQRKKGGKITDRVLKFIPFSTRRRNE